MSLDCGGSWCWDKSKWLKYNTVQIVTIQNPKLGILHRSIQLLIACYVCIYVIGIKGGYQRYAPVSGSSTIKVKGSAYNSGGIPWLIGTGPGGTTPDAPPHYAQIFDSTDLIYPSSEKDAVFIATNMWVTENQTRTTCYPGSDEWWTVQIPPEKEALKDEICDAACVRGTLKNEADTTSGGVFTGEYTLKPDSHSDMINCYCELYTWCPDENVRPVSETKNNSFVLHGIGDWTISVRTNVAFDAFNGVKTSNMPTNGSNVPPLYTVSWLAEQVDLTYESMRAKGAVIVFRSHWSCNLDHALSECQPTVEIDRLATSFNFRRTEYDSGLFSERQLLKMFGLRMVLVLTGVAGKFDFAALFTQIGAGIGLLAVSGLVADFCAVNLLGHRAVYKKAKFKKVEVNEVDGQVRMSGMDGEVVSPLGAAESLVRIPTAANFKGINPLHFFSRDGNNSSNAEMQSPGPGPMSPSQSPEGHEQAAPTTGLQARYGTSGVRTVRPGSVVSDDEDDPEEPWGRRA